MKTPLNKYKQFYEALRSAVLFNEGIELEPEDFLNKTVEQLTEELKALAQPEEE